MKPLSILAVDDSPSFLAVLVEMLKGDGHLVSTATSGEEGVEIYQQLKPDMVLMDRVMAGIGGVEAVRQIRKIKTANWVPMIMLTTSMSDEDVMDASLAGVDEFLLKPINPLHLRLRLQSIMRIASIQRSKMAVIDELLDGVIRIDVAGVISVFNPAAEKIFGYSASEVIGKNVSMLMPNPDSERHDSYIQNYFATGEAKIIGKGRKVVGLRANKEVFPMHLGITEANAPDGRFFIGVVRDLSAEEAMRSRIEHLAKFDGLTKLPNRQSCIDHLEQRYHHQGSPLPFTLFYLDLDGFKLVNDEHGHAAGDVVLIAAVERIQSVLFLRDFFGRMGGDEFIISIDGNFSDVEAMRVGRRILASMEKPLQTPRGIFQLGVSIGYAHSRDYLKSHEDLTHAADGAMYRVKRDGKGQVRAAALTPAN